MAIGFVADLHVGNHHVCGGPTVETMNQRCMQTIEVLYRAVEAAEEAQCYTLVVAGDVFDTVRPTPQMISALGDVLLGFDGSVILLKGNHDLVSDLESDHSLGPLELATHVEVVSRSRVVADGSVLLWLVPYQTGPASVWLPRELETLDTQSNRPVVLALHLGIHDQKIRDSHHWAKDADDAVSVEQLRELCQKHEIGCVVSGNWHGYKAFAPDPIYQIGALCPTGWDNPGLEGYGSLLVYDGGVRRMEIPGPRFIDWRPGQELPEGPAVYVRSKALPGWLATAREHLQKLKDDGAICDFDLRVDHHVVAEQARAAALASRSQETLDDALGAFVGTMPLEEGVDRARVLNFSRRYLDGAA